MVRIQCFHCRGPVSVPGRRTEILQAAQHGQKKKSSVKEKDSDQYQISHQNSKARCQ